jgi:hypothetical protein
VMSFGQLAGDDRAHQRSDVRLIPPGAQSPFYRELNSNSPEGAHVGR